MDKMKSFEKKVEEEENNLIDLYLQAYMEYSGMAKKLTRSQYNRVFDALRKGFDSVFDNNELYFTVTDVIERGLDEAGEYMGSKEWDIVTGCM